MITTEIVPQALSALKDLPWKSQFLFQMEVVILVLLVTIVLPVQSLKLLASQAHIKIQLNKVLVKLAKLVITALILE
jgi:hypothetical protein